MDFVAAKHESFGISALRAQSNNASNRLVNPQAELGKSVDSPRTQSEAESESIRK